MLTTVELAATHTIPFKAILKDFTGHHPKPRINNKRKGITKQKDRRLKNKKIK